MRKCRLQIIAFVLLLAFTQKLGLRVMLHNRYHAAAQQNTAGNASYYQVQCDCLDEALVPLDNPVLAELPVPAETLIPLHNNYSVHLSSAIKVYRSLRAPPVS